MNLRSVSANQGGKGSANPVLCRHPRVPHSLPNLGFPMSPLRGSIENPRSGLLFQLDLELIKAPGPSPSARRPRAPAAPDAARHAPRDAATDGLVLTVYWHAVTAPPCPHPPLAAPSSPLAEPPLPARGEWSAGEWSRGKPCAPPCGRSTTPCRIELTGTPLRGQGGPGSYAGRHCPTRSAMKLEVHEYRANDTCCLTGKETEVPVVTSEHGLLDQSPSRSKACYSLPR